MRVLAASETSAGSLALLIILLLLVTTVLLIRNMRKRIERLPESFTPPEESDGSASGPTAGA